MLRQRDGTLGVGLSNLEAGVDQGFFPGIIAVGLLLSPSEGRFRVFPGPIAHLADKIIFSPLQLITQ